MSLTPLLWAKVVALAAVLAWAASEWWPEAQPAASAPSMVPERGATATVVPLQAEGQRAHADGAALVVDANLRALFDALLAAHAPAAPAEADLAAMHLTLEQHFAGRAAGQAKRLLAQYAQYQHAWALAARAVQPEGHQAETLHALVTASTRLRAQFFSPEEALGLFGGATTGSVPGDRSPAVPTPTRLSEVAETVRGLRAQGAGDDEIYRLRASALSAQAADALGAMDREQRSWDARLAAYQQERHTLREVQAGTPHDVQQTALQRLRDTRFGPEEQQRLAAYEKDDGPQLQLP